MVEADYAERDVRLYGYKLNHLVDVYGVYRKWAAANDVSEGHASWYQVAQLLYDDLPTRDDALGVIRSVKRWTHELQRLGLLTVREHKNARGQFDGIWWALPSDVASARSSAGSSVGSCSYRRRQETHQEAAERRVRPWCRRSGRKGVDRYVAGSPPPPPPPPTPFLRPDSCLLHSPPSVGGGGAVQQDVTRAPLAVNTRPVHDVTADAAALVVDQPPGTATAVAAARRTNDLSREEGSKSRPDRSAELAAALQAFEAKFGKASVPVTPVWFERYQAAASRAELYGGWGVRQRGLGVRFLLDRIESWDGKPHRRRGEQASAMQLHRPKAPASLAYFIALLDDASKHWRHAYRHEHGQCRRPELCRANAWMYPAFDDRLRNRSKWIAYDREVEQVRRVLNDAGYAAAGSGEGK